MPCKKCKDGKYKYGNTGECKYDTKEECDKANPKKYNKMKEYPTPLGKKTYEEYAKELKEFNLSAEPKLQKVELLKTPVKILKELKALDNSSLKQSEVIDKAYLKYKNAQEKFVKQIEEARKERQLLATAILDVKRALKELGLNPKEVADVNEADRISDKLKDILKRYLTLYPQV